MKQKLTDEERELIAFFNEDFHWFNAIKAQVALQNKDIELINTFGDKEDDLISQVNDVNEGIEQYRKRLIERRKYKKSLFASLSPDLKAVLEMRYLCYMTFEAIAAALNYNTSTVFRKHKKAILLLTIILGGWKNERNTTLHDTIRAKIEEEQSENSD
jgi:DNA-directed RNA polymerase specialized sigma subunit